MTRKFTFLLMALLALAGFKSWGQETLTVYENGTANGEIPLNTGWIDTQGTISQCIIPASELGAMTGGTISQMKFYIYQAGQYGSIQNATLECSLGEVATTTITSAITTGLTPVWSGNLDFSETNLTVTFTTPYQYNGGNLLISFEVVISSGYTGYTFYGTSTNYQSCFSNQYISDNQFLPKTTFTYTGGSSCIAPTGLAASNITAEGATISWNDNGAESYNLDVNGTVYENVTNPYILDVELSTTYTVKVQAVCGENETSAWSSAINFTTPDCWDGHTINYTLTDSYGDGWNGAYLTIVDKSNNNTIKTLTLSSGRTESGSLTLCSGTYDFVWHKGSYDSECSFSISENGETLFTCYNASVYTNGQVVYTLDLLEKFSITLSQPGEEFGTISADLEEATAGTTVTLSATPATGYEFGEWTVINSTTSQEITVTDNQFEMPDSDVTVTATFEALVPHTVTIADGIQNGTVRLFDGDPTEYMAGATVSLEVLPAEGYFYPNKDEITVTDANGNNIDVTITDATNYSFIMPNSNVTVFAVFNLYYGVQVDTEILGGHISVTSDFEHYPTLPFFTAGTYVYFIPSPDEDYEYVEQSVRVYEWDLEQHEIGDPITVDFSSGSARITMPETDIFVTATFNRTKFNVTNQIVNPAESGYFYIENDYHIEVGTPVVISNIEPAWDYQFASVSVTRNDNQAAVETYAYYGDYIFYMPNSDVTVTVNFEAIPYYDVTINEPENGSAYINGAQSYHAGDEVVLTANPDEGYIISATDITITPAEGEPFHPTYVEYTGYVFNMPASDVTITAAFREIQTYTINYYVNGELEGTASCKENEAIDIYTYTPYVYGVNFEGWGVAPIGTYVTEKPTIIGDDEHPTQNYDLHAVFSYSEDVPATSKDGDTWVEVTSSSDLSNGDQVIFVEKINSKVLTERTGEYDGCFRSANITISNNEISSIPSNAVVFEAESTSGSWKFWFDDAQHPGLTTLTDYSGGYLVPMSMGWGGSDSWTIISDGSSVNIQGGSGNYIVYKSGDFTVDGSSVYKRSSLFKKYNPFITTNYYMTSVLTNGEIAENTTAKNIIISSLTSISVKNGATLTMDANGLFRNENEYISFMFEDGAQFYYTGEETIKAIFEKEIAAYEDENSRDGYYLIANPTDNTAVLFLDDYDYDLYTFDPTQALEWQNERVTEGTPVVTRGTGYLYACAVNNALRFTGNLMPAGSTNKSLTYAAAGEGIDFPGFNLIGNPYACNAYVEGYNFYRMVDGELQAAGTTATVAPCEGFFVEATANGQSVSLSTTAPEAPASLLNITVSQNRGNVIDRAIVNFNDNNDLHKFMMNPAHTNLSIAKGGETFAAISTEAEGELPVNFKAEKDGTYTISVNTENVEANYLHLIDNLTGMDTDLLSTPSYTFNATTSDYASRFKLVFSMNNNEDMSQANSFAYINNGEIIISNEGRATLQVIDVLGRIVSSEEINGECRISTNGLTAGLYILNLNGMTQKIVVR
ncbi:MAG: T9SS type A sorting domain-containing protein [Bacteroidales bacterium]|nr:T9SS type A sorting domain-containing protein [Bacteroidales bacterium]